MSNKTVEVRLELCWTFDSKEWKSTKEFMENLGLLKEKITFDPKDAYYHLNQICTPHVELVSVREKKQDNEEKVIPTVLVLDP